MAKPRDYQLAAVESVRDCIRRGKRRVLVAAPTGAGKTILGSHMAEQTVANGLFVIFVAHRRELITQSYRKMLGCTCALGFDHDYKPDPSCESSGLAKREVGIIMANDPRRRSGAHVQVASIDTLRHRNKPRCDVLFIDEAHRCRSPSYVRLVDELMLRNPNLVVVGLTATPYRADGKPMSDSYDDIVVVATVRELITASWLAEPRIFSARPEGLPDLSNVHTRMGDFDLKELDEAVDQTQLVGDIVAHWKKNRATRGGTVCFASSVAHSKHIVELFCGEDHPAEPRKIRAEHLDGTTPAAERDAMLARLERGEIDIISNMGVLQEGWDQPSCKTLILARPTKSLGLYLQQAGRILRPWRGVQPVILDHSWNVMEHGLPQDDRELSLVPPKKRRKRDDEEKIPSCRTCEKCFAIFSSLERKCPACGHEMEIVSRPAPEVKEGDLVEISDATTDEKRQFWDEMVEECRRKGWKQGAAYHRFIDKFGHKPPSAWRDEEALVRRNASDEEKLEKLAELEDQARRESRKSGWLVWQFRSYFGCNPPTAFEISKMRARMTG